MRETNGERECMIKRMNAWLQFSLIAIAMLSVVNVLPCFQQLSLARPFFLSLATMAAAAAADEKRVRRRELEGMRERERKEAASLAGLVVAAVLLFPSQ